MSESAFIPRWWRKLRALARFRLRTLLIAVTLVAAATGWFVRNLEQARRQRDGVEWLTGLGGDYFYDFEYDRATEKGDHTRTSPIPGFLRVWLGDDFFHDVVCVEFTEIPIGDDDLAQLSAFPRLEVLAYCCDAPRFTRQGLVYLRAVPELRVLALDGILVFREGLEHILTLKRLEWLRVCVCDMSDDDLRALVSLNRLRRLEISTFGENSTVTQEGLAELRRSLPEYQNR